ncbi:MAG: phosphatase PAP2 family protein [Candidatus Eremiobacteraeota bacterium]|nr:phosphatase PAP2 family protein [Candidatus Eremiobacteraeota bacterium]
MLLVAFDCFAAFAVLGVLVMKFPHSLYDIRGAGFRGVATPLAAIFTESGRWRWLTILGVLGFLIFAVMRWPLWIPVALSASQLVSQAVVEGVKRAFKRARPRDWLVRAEFGFSYPSGHAATAVTFYGAWAVVCAHLPLPLAVRVCLVVFLGSWGVGIMWSRLALSAHYVTDVLGGWLFGCGWLCAMLALAGYVNLSA